MGCADFTPQMLLFGIFTIGSVEDQAITMAAIEHRLRHAESQERLQAAERVRE